MELDSIVSDDATDEDDQKPQPSEDIRKSGRKKRPPTSYSPERTEIKRRRVLKKNAVNSLIRKCDLLPNGEPFSCGRCGSPYVVNKRSKTSLKNCQSRHRPLPYEIYDPITKKNLLICNFCYLIFVKKRAKRASLTKKPEPEVKEHYIQTCMAEAQALANRLQKPEASRLFCPEYSKEPCGCIQKYIKNQGDPGQADIRARELCDLLQKSLQLSKLKFYPLPELDSNDKPIRKNARKKNFVGLGMGHKRSKAFEAFVLEKRQYLRNVVKLCERGSQKVLVYSNNFLHKRLKTEKDNCRVVIQRSKRTMGLLTAFEEFSKNKCCVDNCVKMADTHRKLLMDWRERARTSQIEARRVIAEMLIPSAGCSKNCYNFINMVTGSSKGIISKVSQQMLWTGGDKEPPVHGLVKRANSTKAHTQSQPQPLHKTNTNVSTGINPGLEVHDIYGQPSEELEQVSGHPESQLHNQPDSKQQAVNSPDSQQQQLLQLQQIFEHQQQQLIQQQLLQHTLLNERMDNSSCTAQNVISIQQLMDQMSVQVMNTQLQLQQSLQQLIAMGTQSNQSELSVPAVNQSQLILSANQQHRGVIVNNQQENLQENTLIRPQPIDQHNTVGQTPQPMYIQLNQAMGQTSYIQGLPMTQANYLTPVGTFVYSRGNSSFIPYNQTCINSSNSSQTGVSTVNSSFSQTTNIQCNTAASTVSAINGGDRIQSSSSGSAFVTVSKPTENVTPNVVTSVTKSHPSQITVVYPGTKSFVKQKVPASTSSSSVANETTVGVLRGSVRATGDTKSQRYSVAPPARQATKQNPVKESFATHATSVPLNPTKTTDQGQTVASSPISTPNCVPPSSDKVIQVQAITDPNMLLKLLEQSSCVQTPNNTTSAKPAPVTSTFIGESDNTRLNSVVHINPSQGNILVQENHSQVIHVSSVQNGIPNSTNVNPPSYTYILNPTTPPSQPVTVDVGHQMEQPPAAVATNLDPNTAPNPGSAMNCVNSPNTALATQNLPNPQLVAIDPNLLIRLCQQAFSYQALDPGKDKAKKPQ